MFRGLAAISIDDKGRITIPVQYRQAIAQEANGQLVLTIDTEDKCLLLYPLHHWQIIEQKLEQLPSFHPVTRRIQRLLIGHATELELDRSGRILVPPLLREFAAIDKTAMLVGQGKKIELWSESHWESHREGWLNKDKDDHTQLPPELLSVYL